MAESLRDQLLKSGLTRSVPKAPRAPAPKKPRGEVSRKPSMSAGDIDLAKAYALRSQTEAAEKKRLTQEAEAAARAKKERRRKLQTLLTNAVLNKVDAEHARHFEHRSKIRRVHVDADQLAALNGGALGIVQCGGSYLVVSADIARQAAEIDADALALLVDLDTSVGVDDDGIPDDLIW